MMTKEDFIRRTFELARQGMGTTWPNPLVGCVITKGGRIIAEGFHQRPGSAHAEADALNNCSESPEGSTVYVNLEPCCHTNKRTPPCAQRLIKEKVRKVVISTLDPHPEVSGKGVELLSSHGIEVEHGILQAEGEKLNEVFFLAHRKKRPFIHLKLAATLDGRIALPSGESQWITKDEARHHVHVLRSRHQAIAVGAETVRQDNPRLNVRLADFQGEQPWRVVFSRSQNLPRDFHLFSDELKEKTLVYQDIQEGLADLFHRGIINVLLEGGPRLASAFMQAGLVDRVSLYQNPSFLGAGPSLLHDIGVKALNDRPRLKDLESQWLGEDFYLTGRLT